MGLYYFQYAINCSLHVTEVSPSPLVPSPGIEDLSVQLESSSMTPCSRFLPSGPALPSEAVCCHLLASTSVTVRIGSLLCCCLQGRFLSGLAYRSFTPLLQLKLAARWGLIRGWEKLSAMVRLVMGARSPTGLDEETGQMKCKKWSNNRNLRLPYLKIIIKKINK